MEIEKRLLFEKKRDIQMAKNILKVIEGIEVLDIFEMKSNSILAKINCNYNQAQQNSKILPISKLSVNSSLTEICRWIRKSIDIIKNKEYFFCCGGLIIKVWTKIKIVEADKAVESMWLCDKKINNKGYCLGFLLVDFISAQLYEVCFDSSDEYHYLIYNWKENKISSLTNCY